MNVYSRLRFVYQCLNDDGMVPPGMCQVLCARDEAPLPRHQIRACGYCCCGGGADDGPCHCSSDVAASPSPSLYCEGYLQLNVRILLRYRNSSLLSQRVRESPTNSNEKYVCARVFICPTLRTGHFEREFLILIGLFKNNNSDWAS